jgi:hypothetical protein
MKRSYAAVPPSKLTVTQSSTECDQHCRRLGAPLAVRIRGDLVGKMAGQTGDDFLLFICS